MDSKCCKRQSWTEKSGEIKTNAWTAHFSIRLKHWLISSVHEAYSTDFFSVCIVAILITLLLELSFIPWIFNLQFLFAVNIFYRRCSFFSIIINSDFVFFSLCSFCYFHDILWFGRSCMWYSIMHHWALYELKTRKLIRNNIIHSVSVCVCVCKLSLVSESLFNV